MAIENTVSIDFWSTFVDCWWRFSIAAYPVCSNNLAYLQKTWFQVGECIHVAIDQYGLKVYRNWGELNPVKYHRFENIMENGAFAILEQMLHFP